MEGETEENKTMSVFDALEDLDADAVLDKLKRVHDGAVRAGKQASNQR